MTQMLFVLFLAATALFSCKRLSRYLRYLQQDGYSPERFWKWFKGKKAFDRRGTAILVFTALLTLLSSSYAYLIGTILLLLCYYWEENPCESGKLKLVMTSRAKRIFFVSAILYIFLQITVVCVNSAAFWLLEILLIQLLPVLLHAAVFILSFDEKKRQHQLLRGAETTFRQVSPYTIGITGSYGKTSTKDALGNILNVVLGATFWPSKGVNTEMGITREIRESLKPGTRYAVIEMAAYARGSIHKLCQLTPPQAGIITSIGVAHLDRFGSCETILEAKSELAQAIPLDGILVCNGDNAGAREIANRYPKKITLLYGFDNGKRDLDCWIKEHRIGSIETEFVFFWKNQSYKGVTALMGKNALLNLAASFAISCALGAQPDFVIATIANLRSVDNRLELRREKGVTYLRDAYNSNPEGFSDALDVLAKFEKKKFLLTPGMVELKTIEKELHEKIGRKAGGICDYAIIVGATNRQPLTEGLLSGGMSQEQIITVESRERAFKELSLRLETGDAVLIENDLPDLYQDIIRF